MRYKIAGISKLGPIIKDMQTFGDILFKRISSARVMLFTQGEMAQLTFQSFDKYVQLINESPEETISVTYPIGYRADKTPINTTYDYRKEDLISRYQFLGLTQLPVNGIYQLVTIVETLLGDIIREILKEYPVKIPNKRKLDAEVVLEAASLEEVKNSIINSLLNELAYKSPKDYAEEFAKYATINLLEKPAFHRYLELKATRDIYIHNSGIANDIYTSKADRLSRVKAGQLLPVDIQYFLESYESCLQITEILETDLNKIWPSPEFVKSKQTMTVEKEKEQAIEQVIEKAEEAQEEIQKPVRKIRILKVPTKKTVKRKK
ncbi:MAG: hypothetical protein ACOVSR_01425 [Bacteroidia bacterium]